MNKKIEELARAAGFFPVPDETEVDLEYRAENARYEKFAELVIAAYAPGELIAHYDATGMRTLDPDQIETSLYRRVR